MPKYDETFWASLLKKARPQELIGTLSRIVESQQQKVTLPLTDSLDEHDVLEALLEASKPVGSPHPRLARFDYLLRTPWRYPPLRWGSRFGRRFEASLFYGSLDREALFAEAAYYRLVFLEGMSAPFEGRITSQFTVFDASFRTSKGQDLTRKPFAEFEKVLRHRKNYQPTQSLGTALRESGIEAIVYFSARTKSPAKNIGLFSPDALRSLKHRNPRHGLVETRYDGVSFRLDNVVTHYERRQFTVRGSLPLPA